MTHPADPAQPDDDAPWISDDLIPDALEPQKAELSPVIGGAKPEAAQKIAAGKVGDRKHSAELFPVPPLGLETEPDGPNGSPPGDVTIGAASQHPAVGPLPLVETAFLASACSLMWLVNTYFPPGPFLRILFPLPIALVYLRWNARAAWMAATVSMLLLTILLGPTRSIFFLMPYGFLGVQLGCLWRRKAGWGISILTGGLLVALGSFFRIWLLSLLAGEDLWGYSIAQITQLLNWIIRVLTNWGWIGLGALGQPGLGVVSVAAVAMVIFASVVYLFTVHLAAWLVLERLGVAMPEPPGWVQVLIEE
ncbi:MAG: DUF2232 domain-containing protein [Cyanobacteria bacterium J06598_1]